MGSNASTTFSAATATVSLMVLLYRRRQAWRQQRLIQVDIEFVAEKLMNKFNISHRDAAEIAAKTRIRGINQLVSRLNSARRYCHIEDKLYATCVKVIRYFSHMANWRLVSLSLEPFYLLATCVQDLISGAAAMKDIEKKLLPFEFEPLPVSSSKAFGSILPRIIEELKAVAVRSQNPKSFNFDQLLAIASSELRDAMTPSEKIAQLLVIGGEVGDTSKDMETSLRCGHVGGLYIGRNVNITSAQEIHDYMAFLRKSASAAFGELPLLLYTDDEGGHRKSFPRILSEWPNNMTLGATYSYKNDKAKRIFSRALAFNYGRRYGKEIRDLGFNSVCAPCVDVNSTPENPIIGLRSFGSDPKAVADLGEAVARGFLSSGIIPTLKHFPGHGSTSQDSHVSLPTIHHSLEKLEGSDLAPFQAAMDSLGSELLVMSAHIVVPAFSGKHPPGNQQPNLCPATLSKEIMTNQLRGRMHFKGVAITDSLAMAGACAAVSRSGSGWWNEARGMLFADALLAGNDLLHDVSWELRSGNALQSLTRFLVAKITEENTLQSEMIKRVDEAVGRVLRLKLWLLMQDIFRKTSRDTQEDGKQLLPKANEPKDDVINQIESHSVTLVNDDNGNLPIFPAPGMEAKTGRLSSATKLLIVAPESLLPSGQDTFAITKLIRKMAADNVSVKQIALSKSNSPSEKMTKNENEALKCAEQQEVLDQASLSDGIILFTHNFSAEWNKLAHKIYTPQLELAWILYNQFYGKVSELRRCPFCLQNYQFLTFFNRFLWKRPIVLVSVENPYDLRLLPPFHTRIVAYSSTNMGMEATARALAVSFYIYIFVFHNDSTHDSFVPQYLH